MGEPVTLFGDKGQNMTVFSPSEVARLEGEGWSRTRPTGEQLAAEVEKLIAAEKDAIEGRKVITDPVEKADGTIVVAIETEEGTRKREEAAKPKPRKG